MSNQSSWPSPGLTENFISKTQENLKGVPQPYIRNFKVDNNNNPLDCTALVYWMPYAFDRSDNKAQPRTTFYQDVWGLITHAFQGCSSTTQNLNKNLLKVLTEDSILYLPRATVLASARGPQHDWMEPILHSMYNQVILPKLLGIQTRDCFENYRALKLSKSLILRRYFGILKKDHLARNNKTGSSFQATTPGFVLVDPKTRHRSPFPLNNPQ